MASETMDKDKATTHQLALKTQHYMDGVVLRLTNSATVSSDSDHSFNPVDGVACEVSDGCGLVEPYSAPSAANRWNF